MTEGFGPKVQGFDHFNFGDHKKLKKLITNKTAAVMVEPIMGEGGIKVIPEWCLKGLRELCNEKKYYLSLMRSNVELVDQVICKSNLRILVRRLS